MEAILIEIIRTVFLSIIFLTMAWIILPVIRFLRSPIPKTESLQSNYYTEKFDTKTPISNTTNDTNYDKSEILICAKRSPTMTVHTIRQWLKEPSQPHA